MTALPNWLILKNPRDFEALSVKKINYKKLQTPSNATDWLDQVDTYSRRYGNICFLKTCDGLHGRCCLLRRARGKANS